MNEGGQTRFTYYLGAPNGEVAPRALDRSWSLNCELEVPRGGAEGPLVVHGATGWSLYLERAVPTCCYRFAATERTYIRATESVPPGRHVLRWAFERQGAGGIGRLYVDGRQVAEGLVPRPVAFREGAKENFDIGAPAFTGRIIEVVVDTTPELCVDV